MLINCFPVLQEIPWFNEPEPIYAGRLTFDRSDVALYDTETVFSDRFETDSFLSGCSDRVVYSDLTPSAGGGAEGGEEREGEGEEGQIKNEVKYDYMVH